MVLHMPVGYTEMYAAKLNELSRADGDRGAGRREVGAGHGVSGAGRPPPDVPPEADGIVRTRLDLRPLDTPHRPAVDVLFQSAAEVYGSRVLGVVMTGMGADGREGSAWIKAKGGRMITEAEETCVVYGMPRSVVEAGLSDASVPLDAGQAIMDRL